MSNRGGTRALNWLANQPYLLLSLTALFWSGNIVLGRHVADTVPPVLLSLVRWGGACLLMLPFAWPHLKADWPTIRASKGRLLALSLTGIAIYHVISYYALGKTQAINALLIQSSGPLFVALWSLVLYGTRLSARQAVGIAVSLTGVLVIILRGDVATLHAVDLNLGDVLFLIGMLVFGFYSALRRPAIHQLSLLTVIAGLAAAVLFPFVLAEAALVRAPTFDLTTGLSFLYVMTLPSAVAYLFFNRGVELVGANRAAPFFHLQPVFGSVLAIALLGESFRLFHLVGYALVLAGVFTAARK